MYSHDGRFLVKTIPDSELNTLKTMLKAYYEVSSIPARFFFFLSSSFCLLTSFVNPSICWSTPSLCWRVSSGCTRSTRPSLWWWKTCSILRNPSTRFTTSRYLFLSSLFSPFTNHSHAATLNRVQLSAGPVPEGWRRIWICTAPSDWTRPQPCSS